MVRNDRLAACIAASGLTYDGLARELRTAALESGLDLGACGRSNIAKWVAGTRPSKHIPRLLTEVLARHTGQVLTTADLGLEASTPDDAEVDWDRSAVDNLLTIGRADVQRRTFTAGMLYSLAALSIPLDHWDEIAGRGHTAARTGARVGRGDITAVQEMLNLFQSTDERLGGGHARAAIVEYLTTDVAAFLTGRFATPHDREDMFRAAAELTFVAGWKAFDSGANGAAQRYLLTAVRLANEADDRPLAAYILRGLAHQAADLGHGRHCLALSDLALRLAGSHATPGLTALVLTLRARGTALIGDAPATTSTLRTAAALLGRSDPHSEPHWLRAIGLGEAIFASQAGQALRDLGDNPNAVRELQRAVALRDGAAFKRVHGLTLAHLGQAQFQAGTVDTAVSSWHRSIDHIVGVRSHRTRQALVSMRRQLHTIGGRMSPEARRLSSRLREELRTTA